MNLSHLVVSRRKLDLWFLMPVCWSSRCSQTRTNEKSEQCMGCRCVSDLIALEFKLPAVTKFIKEHKEKGFFCLEASSWRLLPVSVICQIVRYVNN